MTFSFFILTPSIIIGAYLALYRGPFAGFGLNVIRGAHISATERTM